MKNLLDKYYKFNNPNKIEFLEYELEKDSNKESFNEITNKEAYKLIETYIDAKNYEGAYILMNYLGYKLSVDSPISSFSQFNSFINSLNSNYHDDLDDMFSDMDCYEDEDEDINMEIDIYLYSFMFFNVDYIKFCHSKEYNIRSENIRPLFDFYFLVKYKNHLKFDLSSSEIEIFVNDLKSFLNQEHGCSYIISEQILTKLNQNDLISIFKNESNLLDIKNSFDNTIIPEIKKNIRYLKQLEPILEEFSEYFSFNFDDFYLTLVSNFDIHNSDNFDYALKFFSKYGFNINTENQDGDNFSFIFIKNQKNIFEDDYNSTELDKIFAFLLNKGSNLITHKNKNGENIGHILLNNDMLSKYLILFLFTLDVDLWVADHNKNSIIDHIRNNKYYDHLVPIIEIKKTKYDNLIVSNEIMKSTNISIDKKRL